MPYTERAFSFGFICQNSQKHCVAIKENQSCLPLYLPEQLSIELISCLGELQAAKGAGMRCMITYTSSTEDQNFDGAERILSALDKANPPLQIEDLMKAAESLSDDRVKIETA